MAAEPGAISAGFSGLAKLATGIPGLDHVTDGGLLPGRTTLVSGTAGSAKTILSAQFLAAGIQQRGEHGVFVTLKESPADIRANCIGFGWNIEQWEREGKWAFVDGSLRPDEEVVFAGAYDFGALAARVEAAVAKVGAVRLSMDSLGAVFSQFDNDAVVRRELFRLSSALKRMNVTSMLTVERCNEYGEIGKYGVEEFVADNVILLRNVLEEEKRRRTLEVLKFRGTMHRKGEYSFTVIPGEGIVVIPLSAVELAERSSTVRITSGNSDLDRMCGGGFFRDSIVLVSGATGTGKTLMSTEFIRGGTASKEKCLLLAYEESREQLFRNASGWGTDFERMEQAGLLRVECSYPETAALEDHLIRIKHLIDTFEPNRLALDSLSALERVSTLRGFREFIIGLTSFIKDREIAALLTSTAPTLMGGASVTETHISTITDTIILLRYVEMFGEVRRRLTVLKMRGSPHDKDIREFSIDAEGMHLGRPFREVAGILSGNPGCLSSSEIDRIGRLFGSEESA